MNSKIRVRPVTGADELNSLYTDFVAAFYDRQDREAALKLTPRLEALLAASPEDADSIRGEEVRSLIAELRGDLTNAIRSREAEIRKILELHALSVNTPNWKFVERRYDFSDVSDRLDLLAILYDQQGELARASSVLRESKAYCESHAIEFDGADLLDELERAQLKVKDSPLGKSPRSKSRKSPARRPRSR